MMPFSGSAQHLQGQPDTSAPDGIEETAEIALIYA